jgi:hypothetical protein
LYEAIKQRATNAARQSLDAEVAQNALPLLNMLVFFHYKNIIEDIF